MPTHHITATVLDRSTSQLVPQLNLNFIYFTEVDGTSNGLLNSTVHSDRDKIRL